MAKGEYAGDEFSLEDTMRVGEFSLEEALEEGPVVLAFFPGAYTPVCVEEMVELQDSLENFRERGVSLYGVSVDTPFTLNNFVEDCEIDFPLLSDHDKSLIEAFDVVYDDFTEFERFGYEYTGPLRIAKRSVFALDADGTVAYEWVSNSPMGLPDTEEVEEAAAAVT